MLKINEIFHSIQGEGSKAGLPCVFVRLTFCNLRCTYCDTEYAFDEGRDYSVSNIVEEVDKYNCKLVEVTGGEPLMQEEVLELMTVLCDKGYEVLIETGGSLPIEKIDTRVKIIMDLKCPSSGMEKKNLYENISHLKTDDEVKFVIGDRNDYEWSREMLERFNLTKNAQVLFSGVFGKINNQQLAEWILEDKLNVRFQLQLHKYIWDPNKRGV